MTSVLFLLKHELADGFFGRKMSWLNRRSKLELGEFCRCKVVPENGERKRQLEACEVKRVDGAEREKGYRVKREWKKK